MHALALCLGGVVLLLPSCQSNEVKEGRQSMTKKKESLERYHERRSVAHSGEPTGAEKSEKHKKPIFVVQKHAASHLHYDFRLEIDGVLVSWAIPKGPSMNPKERRLAVPTDDHPMAYADFEGTIPEGDYGAGTVMVWDKGTYDNLKQKEDKPIAMHTCHTDGRIEIELHGKKLQGAFALIRTGAQNDERWLLIKMRDMCAQITGDIVEDQPLSVLTGRTMEEIAAGGKKHAHH